MHDEWTPQPGDEDLLRELDAQGDSPVPYDELGLSPELASAAIAEENARADLIMEEIRAGRLTPPAPSGASHVDWDVVERQFEAEKRAVAEDGWREIARRETHTFGAPKLTTLLHLRASRETSLVRTFFPASHSRRRPRSRSRTFRRRCRSPGRQRCPDDHEPPPVGGLHDAGGRL